MAEIIANIVNNRRLLLISGAIFILIASGLFYISLDPVAGLVVLLLSLSIPLIYVVIKYPKVWLWTIALTSFIFFRSSDEGVSVLDVAFGAFYIGSIFIWLIWMILIKKEKVIYSIADWLLVFFYIASVFNIIIGILNGIEVLQWFREYALYSNVLLYFPLKHYMKDKKDMQILFVLFAFTVLMSTIDQMRSYREVALSQSVYAYQLGISVRLNQTLFSASIFYMLALSLMPMKKWTRVAIWILTATAVGGLIVSFSRTFWLFALAGLFLMLFFINFKQKIILSVGLLLILALGLTAFFTVFEGKTQVMTKILTDRFLSSTQGTKDVSVQIRLVEYASVIKHIKENPMFGNGFGKSFYFYEPNMHFTVNPKNIHNGYLYLAYRLGIPLALTFIFIVFFHLARGAVNGQKNKDDFWRHTSVAAFLSILMIIVAGFTSNQFFARDGGIVLAVSFAIISIANDKRQNNAL